MMSVSGRFKKGKASSMEVDKPARLPRPQGQRGGGPTKVISGNGNRVVGDDPSVMPRRRSKLGIGLSRTAGMACHGVALVPAGYSILKVMPTSRQQLRMSLPARPSPDLSPVGRREVT
jgi:hypothetical protein